MYRIWESGFAAVSPPGPSELNPADWIAWHFTHLGNVSSIAGRAALVCHSMGFPHVDIADHGIKNDRLSRRIDLPHPYPESVVGDHVPFYLAPRSPMLYRIANERHDQKSLVYFGVRLGDLIPEVTWCVSDGNARSEFTEFCASLDRVGSFVDFSTLKLKYWKSAEDSDRTRRRQAELLVHGRLPVSLVRYVVCKADETLAAARQALGVVGGMMQYQVEPRNYFMEIPDDR
ncbi:DUF4433 domain-containing protein [Mycobacterium vicinigordonae]|nr:DUF4433 domain-containing protein [Mycobacterium vicinigordonae]